MTGRARAEAPRRLGDAALDDVSGGGASVSGTHGADTLRGTEGHDTLVGGRGDDQVLGSRGNDLIVLGTGNDSVWDDEGDNTILGGAGEDTIFGGSGDDSIEGGAGDGVRDVIDGGLGNDSFAWAPGDGSDHISSRSGTATLELIGVSLGQLEQLILDGKVTTFSGAPVQLSVEGDMVSFLGPNGRPMIFSGEIAFGHETLRLVGIERFRLA